jgi:1-acyl-sn-glycerol-3-phosphate acyltransferase
MAQRHRPSCGEALNMLLADRPVQLHGSRLAHAVLRLLGWTLVFDGLPARQGVAIVYPHTSNWDFVYGMLAKWAIGLQVTIWGKASLFRVPLFGRWLRWMGGRPVDRSSPQGIVGQMARELREARERGDFLWLALAPEGTRGYVEGWRTGFYHVAVEAGVPLGLAYIDYATRSVGVGHFLRLSGDIDADFAEIANLLGRRRGKLPQLAAPIRIRRTTP